MCKYQFRNNGSLSCFISQVNMFGNFKQHGSGYCLFLAMERFENYQQTKFSVAQ